MFGLEDQKKKKFEPFVFDFEKDMKDTKKYRDMLKRIEDRIQQLKKILKSGESKEEFDKLGVLLHGYTAFLKVMSRCLTKPKA